MRYELYPGATSVRAEVFLSDPITFTPLTGKVAADLACWYTSPGGGAPVQVPLTDATNLADAFSAGKIKEVSSTLRPGWYSIHLPNVFSTLFHVGFSITPSTPQAGVLYGDVVCVVDQAAKQLGPFTADAAPNTVLGVLRALLRKDVSLTGSDVGGNYNNVTMALEAIKTLGLPIAALPDGLDGMAALLDIWCCIRGDSTGTGTSTENFKNSVGAVRIIANFDGNKNRTVTQAT